MRCSRCHKDISRGTIFCPFCGTKIENSNLKKQHIGTRITAFIVVIALAALGGAGLYMRTQGDAETFVTVQNELENIAALNNEELPEIYYDEDDNLPRFISGKFSDKTVSSCEDAKDALKDISHLLGISNVEAEFEAANEQSYEGYSYYRLQQMYKGLEVYGKNVVVSANSEGEITSFSGDYDAVSNINLKPVISEDDAETAVSDALGEYISMIQDGLVIYPVNDTDMQLAYQVSVCASTGDGHEDEFISQEVFVSAENGQIIATEDNISCETVLGTGIDNTNSEEVREFNTWYDSESKKYLLSDRERNINVYNMNYGILKSYPIIVDKNNDVVCYPEDGKWKMVTGDEVHVHNNDGYVTITDTSGNVLASGNVYITAYLTTEGFSINSGTSKSPLNMIKSLVGRIEQASNRTTNWSDKQAVTAMYNVTKIYQYYLDTFQRKGFDGLESCIHVVYDDLMGNAGAGNASSESIKGSYMILRFGTKNEITLNCVGHEYTHGVLNSICGLSGEGESGAINEAYCDIMACLSTGEDNWTEGSRNMENPVETENPDSVNSQYVQEYIEDDIGKKFVHTNSTIISHAAYLMYDAGISKEKLEQIWYRSMYYLPENADYKTCVYSVICAAQAETCSEDEINIIKRAFSEVGIYNMVTNENDISVDDAYAAYYTILAEYKNACEISSEEYLSNSAKYENLYPHVNPVIMKQYHILYHESPDGSGADEEYSLLYQYYDIDRNGIPELLIGRAFHEIYICDIYSCDGEQAIKLFPDTIITCWDDENENYSFLYLYTDGTLSVGYEQQEYYRLDADGYSLEPCEPDDTTNLQTEYTYNSSWETLAEDIGTDDAIQSVEAKVRKIRNIYSEIRDNEDSYEKQDGGSNTFRYLDESGNIVKIIAYPGAYVDYPSDYVAEYYYSDHRLIFVFIYQEEEWYRFYLDQDLDYPCIRYIDDKGRTYDYESGIDAMEISDVGYFCHLGELEIHWSE